MSLATSAISVVICAYTEARWDAMVASIQSVKTQSLPPREILLVIDHNPTLLSRVRREITGVFSLENSEMPGLSGARNSGIAAASGDIIAFLDEDEVADPEWLQILSQGYTDPGVMGVGGAILPRWSDDEPRWLPEEFYWVIGCTYKGTPKTASPVRNLIGCNMSFRRKVLAEAGGFRNGIGRIGALPAGCEETELCIRAGQRWPGHHFLYQPEARVYHRVPAERTRWDYFLARCYAEGVSKAQVARFVGAVDGLSSERSYAMATLPTGVGKGLIDVFLARDLAGAARSAAISIGLAITTAGYLRGVFSRRFASLMAEEPAPYPYTSEREEDPAGLSSLQNLEESDR